MGHHEHHHHKHDHHPKPIKSSQYHKAFIIGIVLNIAFIIAEVFYGFKANSMALLADAGHNASDVIGLIIAFGAILLRNSKPNERFTYGLQSTTIMAALVNTILLLVITGSLAFEAILRLQNPENTEGWTIIIVATIGIVINGFTALLFYKDSKHDINIKGAYLHMAADAAISLGVVIAGGLFLLTGWLWLDPLLSLLISIIIVLGTVALLKESIYLSLHAAPEHIKPSDVEKYLRHIENVKDVHDLHIWAMSTQDIALSVHLLMPNGHPGDPFIQKINQRLKEEFGINHTTIQIEINEENQHCPVHCR